MFKKTSTYILGFVTLLFLFTYYFNHKFELNVDNQGKNVLISKTEIQTNLSDFINRYNSGVFETVKILGDKTMYGYKIITGQKNNQMSLMTIRDTIDRKYYDVYIAEKPLNTSISDLGFSTITGSTIIDISNEDMNIFLKFFLETILPLLLLIGVFMFFMKSKGGGLGIPFGMNIGKLSGSKDSPSTNTTFADVAGMEEVKNELVEIVDYLKNPSKYLKVGAKIPKGVLLYGSPGSGKTLLARAVAGEAGVPFYTASGSEFMEMIVGVGAAKVRELFNKAKLTSPSIIFIDEIDAIGKKRGGGHSGGHQEQEQTLNQILTEMDGFEQGQTVIVIAATNRPDILDPALMRSGRFDRKVYVSNPTLDERVEIFQYYLKDKKTDPQVDIHSLARRTSGFSGADIQNIVNEASLQIAKQDKEILSVENFDYALEKLVMGPEKKIKTLKEQERKIVIYHELGHAVTAWTLPDCDPVEKISIVSRGMALGVTWMMPAEDRYLKSKAKFKDDIVSMLGGRAAEEVFFGSEQITTGASNDFERVTAYVYDMICKYGMDEDLGTVQYITNEYGYKAFSEQTAQQIDQKVRQIVLHLYDKAKVILEQYKEKIHGLAKILDEKEYISREEFEEYMQNIPSNNIPAN